MFSEGWKSRLPLVTRSAQLDQLRLKLWPRRCRRNPTSASPTVTRAPKCIQCGREVSPQRGIKTTRRGRPIEALRREQRRSSSRLKRCETNVGHRGGLQRRDGVATTPTDQHALPGDPGAPNTTRSRLERAETHLRRNRATTSRSTTSRRTNRNLEATDWTRPKSCPDLTSNHNDVAVTEFRLTCIEQALDLLEPPDILRRLGYPIHRWSSEVRPPRRVEVLRIVLFRPFPMAMGCLVFGPDGRLSAVHNGKPVVLSRSRQSQERPMTQPQGNHTNAGTLGYVSSGLSPVASAARSRSRDRHRGTSHAARRLPSTRNPPRNRVMNPDALQHYCQNSSPLARRSDSR